MVNLRVRPGPGIPQRLLIPETELIEQFSRSSGPGGQHVNTTDSRVELVFDPRTSTALTELQRARFDGTLRIVASEYRSQHRNRMAARERLADQVRKALAPPPLPRVPTKPSKGSQRRRLDSKRQRGQVKALRSRVHHES